MVAPPGGSNGDAPWHEIFHAWKERVRFVYATIWYILVVGQVVLRTTLEFDSVYCQPPTCPRTSGSNGFYVVFRMVVVVVKI